MMFEDVEVPDLSKEPEGKSEMPQARLDRFDAVYRGVWGDDAPPGYIESAAASMNVIEFEAHEKAKPAFAYSPMFREQEASLDAASPSVLMRLKGGRSG